MADTVTVQRTIDAPPSEVWAALTEPDKIKEYFFGSEVDTDWTPGSPITFRGEYKGRKYEDKGEIKKVEEERSLSFTHYSEMSGKPDKPENYATVTYDLKGKGDQTDLKVTQTNCSGAEEQTKKNWEMVLDGLKTMVEH
ncbi:MAG TPA: SRPBCC domain-containing protein [Hyphomonadaceae bacterium]|nr:SRPBCC domain-containing protein [Hyphomonadaceae bacterium]